MYCQRCGTAEINETCPACGSAPGQTGFDTTTPEAGNPWLQGTPKIVQPSPARDLGGVMGWLLFLCLSLTLLGPFVQGRIAWIALRNLATTSITTNTTILRLSSVCAIYVCLSIFSFCAGLMLWLEDPWGVKVAKAYLLIAPTVVIPLYAILLYAGLKVDLSRIIFGRLVYSVVWYSYLSTSKRVRDTYFRPAF